MGTFYVRDASENHDQILVDIWSANLMNEERARTNLEWNNRCPSKCLHYIIYTEDHQPIGSVSVQPRPFTNGNKQLIGGKFTDMSVNKEHRQLKQALLLTTEATNNALGVCDFVYATPSTNSYPIFKRKFKKFADYTKYVKLLRSDSFIQRKVRNRVLTSVISSVANTALSLSRIPNCLVDRQFKNCYTTLGTSMVNEVKCNLPGLHGNKSSQYLNWRYGRNTTDIYTFKNIDLGSDGYVVLQYDDDTNQIQVLDIITTTQNITDLLISLEQYCLSVDIESIVFEVIGFPELQSFLQRRGYKVRLNGHDIWINKEAQFTIEDTFWVISDGDLL